MKPLAPVTQTGCLGSERDAIDEKLANYGTGGIYFFHGIISFLALRLQFAHENRVCMNFLTSKAILYKYSKLKQKVHEDAYFKYLPMRLTGTPVQTSVAFNMAYYKRTLEGFAVDFLTNELEGPFLLLKK